MEDFGVLWCCSFADGQRRVGRREDRHRSFLSPVPWFRDALCQTCGQAGVDWHLLACLSGRTTVLDAWAWQGQRDHVADVPVTSLLLVGPGTTNEGILTQWELSEDLQRIFYGYPSDAYSLSVKDAFVLDDAQPILFKQQMRQESDGLSRISPTQPLFRAAWGEHVEVANFHGECARTGTQCSLETALLQWQVDFERR